MLKCIYLSSSMKKNLKNSEKMQLQSKILGCQSGSGLEYLNPTRTRNNPANPEASLFVVLNRILIVFLT